MTSKEMAAEIRNILTPIQTGLDLVKHSKDHAETEENLFHLVTDCEQSIARLLHLAKMLAASDLDIPVLQIASAINGRRSTMPSPE